MASRYVRGAIDREVIAEHYVPIQRYAKNALKTAAVIGYSIGLFYLLKAAVLDSYREQNAKAEQIIQAGDRKAASKLLADTRTERTRDPIVPLSDGNEKGLQRLVNQ